MIFKGIDGVNMSYTITKFDHNQELPESTFVFDRSKHQNVEDCLETNQD